MLSEMFFLPTWNRKVKDFPLNKFWLLKWDWNFTICLRVLHNCVTLFQQMKLIWYQFRIKRLNANEADVTQIETVFIFVAIYKTIAWYSFFSRHSIMSGALMSFSPNFIEFNEIIQSLMQSNIIFILSCIFYLAHLHPH